MDANGRENLVACQQAETASLKFMYGLFSGTYSNKSIKKREGLSQPPKYANTGIGNPKLQWQFLSITSQNTHIHMLSFHHRYFG